MHELQSNHLTRELTSVLIESLPHVDPQVLDNVLGSSLRVQLDGFIKGYVVDNADLGPGSCDAKRAESRTPAI
jgi:hypothetical protein